MDGMELITLLSVCLYMAWLVAFVLCKYLVSCLSDYLFQQRFPLFWNKLDQAHCQELIQ